ncbi:MAG: hypothetical protein AB7V04_05020 [Desulfomonilaceae bacterium]
MPKPMKWLIIAAIAVLACYGLFRFVSDHLNYSDGQKAAQTAHPFVQGAANVAGEKLKQTLKETPDATLEQDSELLSRKLYPIVKGAVKGQLDAILNDPNRSELPEKMSQTGKEIAKDVIKPFSEGVVQGSQKILEDVDKGLGEFRKLHEKNKDIFDTVQSGVQAIIQELNRSPQPLPHGQQDQAQPPGQQ